MIDYNMSDDMCSICMDNYTDDDSIFQTTCSHIFHLTCLDRWIQTGAISCPLCRHNNIGECCRRIQTLSLPNTDVSNLNIDENNLGQYSNYNDYLNDRNNNNNHNSNYNDYLNNRNNNNINHNSNYNDYLNNRNNINNNVL